MGTYLDLMERSIFLYDHQKSEIRDFATLKKSFSSKHEVLSEYSISILGVIFSKSQLFSLFLAYNLIGVSRGHDFSYWNKDLRPTNLSDTPNMFFKSTESILDAFEKKCQLKKWGRKLKIEVGMFWKNIVFWTEEKFFKGI